MNRWISVLLTSCFLFSVQVFAEESQGELEETRGFDFKIFKKVSLPSFPDIEVPIYKSRGRRARGPAILLIHGNSSSSRSFLLQKVGRLGQQRKVFLMDLPGFGRASKVDKDIPFPVDENGVPQGFPQYQFGLIEAVSRVASKIKV